MKIRFTGEIDYSGSNQLAQIRANPEPYVLSTIFTTLQGARDDDQAAIDSLKITTKVINPRGRPRKRVFNDGRGDT